MPLSSFIGAECAALFLFKKHYVGELTVLQDFLENPGKEHSWLCCVDRASSQSLQEVNFRTEQLFQGSNFAENGLLLDLILHCYFC